ncbi:MAG TPA: ABC transporter substrate-binding protein [Actinomycetota bacterium]|nr:ABC transporter substrate-binding protein [Actinomycetota bacterium]
MVRKYSKFLVLIAVLAIAATACGGDGGEGTQIEGQEGGDAIQALNDPGELDPAYCGTTSCAEPVGVLFDSLLAYDFRTAAITRNGAADSYEVSADATMITFKLREGAKFHNGEDVTAESFVRGLTRVAVVQQGVTPSDISYHLDGIKGFADAQAGKSKTLPGVHQGANDHELVIELESPNAEFVTRTGHQVYSPVPAAANTADGKPDPKFTTNPIGNGPYKMEGEYRRDVGLKVVKNADYNGKVKGFLNSIEWKIYADLAQEYLEFQAGTVDSSDVEPESYAAAEAAYGEAFVQLQGAALTYVAVNTEDAPTSNKAYRQAISMAINREDIVRTIFNNARVPATGIIPPATFGSRANVCQYCKFDATAAKAKLAEAGGPGPQLVLAYNADGNHGPWMTAVAAQLKENLGLNPKLVPIAKFDDYTGSGDDKFLNSTFFEKPGLARLGWAQDYPTLDNWLFPLLFSTSGDNHSRWKNTEFDNLVKQAQANTNPTERLKQQQDAEDIALEELPIIPMWYSKSAIVYKADKFENFPIDVQYLYPAWEYVSVKAA